MQNNLKVVEKLGRRRARLVRELDANRDALEAAMVEAAVGGASGPAIAEAAGVAHQRVYQVLAQRGRDGGS